MKFASRSVVALAVSWLVVGTCAPVSAGGIVIGPLRSIRISSNAAEVGDFAAIDVDLNNFDYASGGCQAYWFQVCHDPSLVSVQSVVQGSDLVGYDLDYYIATISDDRWNAAAIISLDGTTVLPAGSRHLQRAWYELLAPGTQELCFCWEPDVAAADGSSLSVISYCGTLTAGYSFRRGDANGDGGLDLADAIHVLSWLFDSGPGGSCDQASDVNDDGSVNLADAIFTLTYIFSDGPAPTFGCEPDGTPDDLDCTAYEACP